MTDKYFIENPVEVYEKLKQNCKALREEKAYADMACEQFKEQLKLKKQECEKYKRILAEIKPVLELYANTKVGEELLNGTSQIVIEDLGVLGSIRLTFNPNPARQALQEINEVSDDRQE